MKNGLELLKVIKVYFSCKGVALGFSLGFRSCYRMTTGTFQAFLCIDKIGYRRFCSGIEICCSSRVNGRARKWAMEWLN